MAISFNAGRRDFGLILEIVNRAEQEARALDIDLGPRQALAMDITACHCNGNPLDLQGLLEAPSGDFWHDVGGIRRHIDRTTGQLGDCFSPRCSKHVEREPKVRQ